MKERLKKEIGGLKKKPALLIIQIGDRPESNSYIESKKKFGKAIGVGVIHEKFDEKVTEEEIIRKIGEANADKEISGIIVQLPIPKSLDREKIMNEIAPEKDVDGLGAVNVGRLWEGRSDAFVPATTKGILTLLEKNGILLSGKHVLVIGRSSLVGKPTVFLCLSKDATVTIAHSKTKDLEKYTKSADVLIVATGHPKLIGVSHVLPRHVIVDVGINPQSKAKEKDSSMALQDEILGSTLVGDVDFENVKNIVQAISPVPGGVGPMTVASLFENVVTAYRRQA